LGHAILVVAAKHSGASGPLDESEDLGVLLGRMRRPRAAAGR
jgi:hypothetical protein